MSFEGLTLVHVVAMDNQQCIGHQNALPWHLSADLKHFKALTQGGTVIMGRKTLESMGRALPNRHNWVVTRDHNWHYANTQVAHSIEQALSAAAAEAKLRGEASLFIIGGAEIFKQTLNITDRLEITHIDTEVQGDTFYPAIPASYLITAREPHVDEKTGIAFEFVTYQQNNI